MVHLLPKHSKEAVSGQDIIYFNRTLQKVNKKQFMII